MREGWTTNTTMDAEKDKTPPPYSPPKPERLLSLDTYRGFLMLVLATSAFQLHKVAADLKTGPIWKILTYQFSHPEWRSCSFWDLVQPSFMFMVGVAVPYSVASRRAKGASQKQIVGHALWRSLLLVLLGVFISSNNAKQTDWTFVNVLSQIGLGYTFLVLLEGRGLRMQLATLGGILLGYGLCFAISILCDPQILPFVKSGWVLCPIVKRNWTPSWALFCSGWTLWILAAFYGAIDIAGWKKWTFPFVVVGMNCTAMYCMWQMFKGWVNQSIQTHFGRALFDTAYGPIWASLAWTFVLWLICFWMYRRKIFLKI